MSTETTDSKDAIRELVRQRYAEAALTATRRFACELWQWLLLRERSGTRLR